ncbi:MAG: HK97 gp10 family phage protein [Clostridia bacterium]
MISFKHRGSFSKVEKFLNQMQGAKYLNLLSQYGQEGVAALAAATPVDSGETARSWTYEIEHNSAMTKLSWLNTNVNGSVNVAIILQYGHGTGTGGYVQGVDYINPAIKPLFDKIAEAVWKGVTNA